MKENKTDSYNNTDRFRETIGRTEKNVVILLPVDQIRSKTQEAGETWKELWTALWCLPPCDSEETQQGRDLNKHTHGKWLIDKTGQVRNNNKKSKKKIHGDVALVVEWFLFLLFSHQSLNKQQKKTLG